MLSSSAIRTVRHGLLLAALWGLLLLLASERPLAVPDEGRYGEVGRWMLHSGDWLTPRLNGIPFFHKPPLTYWLEAASMAAFGVSPLALRLVSALHVGLMLVLLYAATRRMAGEALALRAAVMLGTSLGFLLGGQYVNHDMVVASWISVAILAFAVALGQGEQPSRPWAWLGFAACALGLLAKGLIGIVLPALVLLPWLIWQRRLLQILRLPWLSGLTLFAALALPWFVLAQQRYPQLFDYLIVGQHFRRYTASSYNNPQPWWFYLAALMLLMFPWSLLAPAALRRVLGKSNATVVAPGGDHAEPAQAWMRLAWVWLVVITAFFSIPHSKLLGYILPVLAPLALLCAVGWQRLLAHRPGTRALWLLLCTINLVGAVVLNQFSGTVTRSSRAKDTAHALACAARPGEPVYLMDAYPYDLPPLAQLPYPLRVLADWPKLRRESGDGWERELFEGGDFEPATAARLLLPLDALPDGARTPNVWLIRRLPEHDAEPAAPAGYQLFHRSDGWLLYRSQAQGTDTRAPGLAGCRRRD